MQDVFSHSSISAFENCPKKYAFRYIDKIPADSESIEGFVGKRVHEVLERLYQFTDAGKLPSLARVLERYHANWDACYDGERVRIVREGTTLAHYRTMGERCIEGYYRSHYPFDAETTLGLERPVRVSLDSEGRYRLRGFIDRLVRAPDGALEIHDYKTSARMPPRKILERDRQLALYEIAIRKEWQHSGEVRLVWLYLAPNRRYIARRTSEELDRVRSEVMALIDRIRTEAEWAPRETPLCRWCEYRDRCPLWNDASEIPPPARAHPLPAASREDEYQLSLL